MVTHNHALFAYAASSDNPAVGMIVLGSVLPDLPFYFGAPYQAVRHKAFHKGAVDLAKDHWLFGFLLESLHSFLVCGLAMLLTYFFAPILFPLTIGWMSHNVIDFFTHHKEAHAHFHPLSDWRFRSPVSYYEKEFHAAAFTIVEHAAIALLLVWWGLNGRLDGLFNYVSDHGAIFLSGLAFTFLLVTALWIRRNRRAKIDLDNAALEAVDAL